MRQTAVEPEESLEQMMQEGAEARRKQLYRHKLPEERTLTAMLTAMTKAELDDIRFNLNVTGVSSLKKAELAERLCPAITSFAERWMMSLLEEEYDLFRDFAANGGQSESLSDEDDRLDYLRASASSPAASRARSSSGICRKRCLRSLGRWTRRASMTECC